MNRLAVSAALIAGCGVTTLVIADQTNYAYDALGRLRYVQVVGSSATAEYKYDAANNRTNYIVSGTTGSGPLAITPFNNLGLVKPEGVVLAVHVNGFPPPTGMVYFTENGTALGQSYVYSGDASVIVEGLSVGTHTIVASYGGDGINPPFSYTFTIKVRNLSWLPAVLEILLSN